MGIETLFEAKTAAGYVGKALMILAFMGPLSYCEMHAHRERQHVERMKLELQEACIAQRGDWSSWRDSCSFED